MVQISADTDGNEKRYYPETKELVIDAFDRHSVKNFQVAAAASEALDLSDIAAVRGMYLEVDGDCDVVLNGSATPIEMRKSSTTTGVTAKLFIEGIIGSVTIDNTGGAAAVNGDVVLWGDLST